MSLFVTITERPAHYAPRHVTLFENNARRRWYHFLKALHLTK